VSETVVLPAVWALTGGADGMSLARPVRASSCRVAPGRATFGWAPDVVAAGAEVATFTLSVLRDVRNSVGVAIAIIAEAATASGHTRPRRRDGSRGGSVPYADTSGSTAGRGFKAGEDLEVRINERKSPRPAS
jgi:hypothetical protein